MISDSKNSYDSEILSLIKNVAKKNGLHQFTIKNYSGSMKGDGYTGIITAVEVSGEKDGKSEVLNLVVKSALKGNAIRKELPVSDVFKREIYMYNTIIPTVSKFLEDKKLPIYPSFAKCYSATDVENGEAIILENLKCRGYKLWERRNTMDKNHVELVMGQYGRLHAISFALKDQKPDLFKALTENMDDIFCKAMEKSTLITYIIKGFKDFSHTLNPVEDAAVKRILDQFIDTAHGFLTNMKNLPKDYSAILHGDCWSNNMMFAYDDNANLTNPTQVCFIDLQIARVAPPVLDVSYYFYSSSSKEVLDNFQHYLDVYYRSLSEYLKVLGSDPDTLYPYDIFLQQWKELAGFGLLMSVMVIKAMLSDQDEIIDVAELAESGKSIGEAFSYTIANTDEYNNRLKRLVLHFVDNKFM